MTVNREIIESPMAQGVDEVIIYTLDTLPWGGSPANVSVSVYDETERLHTDVTSTVMPTNSPMVVDDLVTLSPLIDLIEGNQYRVEVSWTSAGNTFEAFCIINAER